MNLSRLLCYVGRHDLTTWRRTSKAPPPTTAASLVEMYQNTYTERHCKRPGCRFQEFKPLKFTRAVKRPANEGDTTQGAK